MGWGEAKWGDARWGSPEEIVVTDDGGGKHHFASPETHLPQPGSPLLGVVTRGSCRKTDQRGVARTSPCDVGAVEAP